MRTIKLSKTEAHQLFIELARDSVYVKREDIVSQFERLLRRIELPNIERDGSLEAKVFTSLFAYTDSPGQYMFEDFLVLLSNWGIECEDRLTEQRATQNDSPHRLRLLQAQMLLHGRLFVFCVFSLLLMALMASVQIRDVSKRVLTDAFGPALKFSKFCAGILCPALALLILSYSRWLENFMRRYTLMSWLFNWDYAQRFHVCIGCFVIIVGCAHGLSHLLGDLPYALNHEEALKIALAKKAQNVPNTMSDFLRFRAGWTGVIALAIFFVMALTGALRKRLPSFEIFQVTHLLMYPLFALLLLHGSQALLARPLLPMWLSGPILLVTAERIHRNLWLGLLRRRKSQAFAAGSGRDLVQIEINLSENRLDRCQPGQYILLQVPQLSRFQWHPFTISAVREGALHLHIRTSSGDWTRKLGDLVTIGEVEKVTPLLPAASASLATSKNTHLQTEIQVQVDGPFGAPTRRFFEYDDTILVGAGIGMTPFSAILEHIATKLNGKESPWKNDRERMSKTMPLSLRFSQTRDSLSPCEILGSDSMSRLRQKVSSIQTRKSLEPHSTEFEIQNALDVKSLQMALTKSISHSSTASLIVSANRTPFHGESVPDGTGSNSPAISFQSVALPDSPATARFSASSPRNTIRTRHSGAAFDRLSIAAENLSYWTKQASHAMVDLFASQKAVEIHWCVRTYEEAAWMLSMLDAVASDLILQIVVHLYVTKSGLSEKNRSTTPLVDKVFRQILDSPPACVGENVPSLLTGHHHRLHLDRPNMHSILASYHSERIADTANASGQRAKGAKKRVGVFFCGPKPMEKSLRRACIETTAKGLIDGSHARYHVHAEVF